MVDGSAKGNYRVLAWAVGCWSLAALVTVAAQDPVPEGPTRVLRFNLFERKQEPVLRAKRPVFAPQDSQRLYFDDIYAQGLQGGLPDWSTALAGSGQRPGVTGPGPVGSGPVTGDDATGSAAKPFDGLISAETLEGVIKSQINQLAGQITTPGRFRTEYNNVHLTYVKLASLFAVIEHYGGDVRWRDSATDYRDLIGRASAGTRVGTEQAYQLALRTRDDLQQIVRGERVAIEGKPEPLEDWSNLLYRSPLMIWLEELSLEQLRPMVSDENATKANQAEALQHAEQIAMIAQLLLMPQMEGHDEPDYVKHAQAMRAAVEEMKAAYTRQDFADVGTAVNRIVQACDACHEDYR